MAQAKDAKAPKLTRRPSALKRDMQHEKRRLANRTFKARVNTAIRSFESTLLKKDATVTQAALATVYSLIDKGVKTGTIKQNSAARKKSRLAAKV